MAKQPAALTTATQKPRRRVADSIPAPMPESGFARERQVLHAVGFARSTVRGWIQQGKFPQAVKVNNWCVVWRVQDIRDWMAAQAEGRPWRAA